MAGGNTPFLWLFVFESLWRTDYNPWHFSAAQKLSADRAAVLCDGTADKTIDVLLKLHGYENINRAEFLKQAMDLKAFVNDSKSNKLMEQMLTQDESHPRLATRAYESHGWTNTEQFQGILDGTYTVEKKNSAENQTQEQEVVAAEVVAESASPQHPVDIDALNNALYRVSSELERYTNRADKLDYAFAVFSGIMAGAIDALFVGETIITDGDIALSHQQVNNFIQELITIFPSSRSTAPLPKSTLNISRGT